MPELPEVETIVRDLDRLVRHQTVAHVRVLRPDLIEGGSVAAFEREITGRRIDRVTRRAKNILFHLGDDLLVVNLGMTGRMQVTDDASDPPYLGVRFTLGDGRFLIYSDVRRFGSLRFATAEGWAARESELGLEPLSKEFAADVIYDLAQRSRVAVKTWLMDQRRIVGVGNIYASEALFRAAIDPTRSANSLEPGEVTRLRDSIRQVLEEAIEFRGTTFLDYRDASGERGGFKDRLLVYDREGKPCTVCGTPIARIVQGGRSTFYCTKCQS